MAAMADVTLALFARVATINTGSPSLEIAWPEPKEVFSPPASGKYLVVDFFPNGLRWSGISSGRLDQGLLQVTVVWPKNLGIVAPNQIADLIAAHFPLGQIMTHGSARVKVSGHPVAAQPLPGDADVRVPVTIPWTA